MRHDNKKVQKFLSKWNRETETAEHNNWAIYSQVPIDGRWGRRPPVPGRWQHWPFLPGDNIKALVVIQLRAHKTSKTRWVMLEPTAVTKDLWPVTDPIRGDHDPGRARLENWWIFCWNPPLRPPLRFWEREREKREREKRLKTNDPLQSNQHHSLSPISPPLLSSQAPIS